MFVYKGNDFEKIGDFIQRISAEYPKAEILTKSNLPDAEIVQSNKQYIQIVTVKPIAELPPELDSKQDLNEKVCEKVSNYYLTNKVDTFLCDRPLMKDAVDKDNEFKSLWCERTILKIEHQLPGILRWFEVVDCKVKQLTPVENACDTIENMNKELKKLIISYNYDPNKQLTNLTMRLQGTIDASVNGGVRKYQEAFFDPNYIESHVSYYQYIKRLKKLILNQISLLETGLVLHQKLVPTSLVPLHEVLVEKFSLMKNSFIRDSSYIVDIGPNDKKASILSTPLPPIPPSQHNHKTVSQLRSGRESMNGNSSEDDLYSVLEADGKLTRQSLSPSSFSSVSSLTSSRHKSINGLSQASLVFNAPVAHNTSSSSLANGQANNKIVYVALSNGTNQLIGQQRSNSMPRNNMQKLVGEPHSSSAFPPLPPRSSQIISQSSLESGIETDLSSNSDSSSKPVLPRRTNKKPTTTTILSSSNLGSDQSPSMLISIDIDKSRPNSLNTVISSNATYIENLNRDNAADVPPPLPKKSNRLPTSRSTTIINIGNNELASSLENGGALVSTNGLLTGGNLLSTNGLLNGGLINHHFDNGCLNSASSSTMSMSTSSSTNEYVFTESFGSMTTTTMSTNSSSKTETIHHQIQNLGLNDPKEH